MAENDIPAGYRLHYMEVFNWGTFDRQVYRIEPEGDNSLLTGANGSGKTTFIDALLSLLVPMRKYRFYNQSSHTQRKNERTELSYVRGAYGERQEAGRLQAVTDYLRGKDCRSILLAYFYHAEKDQHITLFQVRYFSGNDLKRHYGIGRVPLSIREDFAQIDARGEWKKALKRKYPKQRMQQAVSFSSSGRQYGQKIIRLFGMRSEKALSLFNQTVGIKVLGDLDVFIRENMLEAQGIEEDFEALRQHFQNLLQAQQQIDKASAQREQLQAIAKLAQQQESLEKQIDQNKDWLLVSRFYFAELGQLYTQEAIRAVNLEEKKLEKEIQILKNQEKDLQERRDELRLAIQQNQIGQQIQQLQQRIEKLREQKAQRQAQAERYKQLCQAFSPLHEGLSAELFNANRKQLQRLLQENGQQKEELQDRRFKLRQSLEEHEKQLRHLKKDLDTLRKQKNKITGDSQRIRQELLRATGASTAELPFTAELIKVKSEERAWEAAIEQLLRNFGLQLLVPEKHYARVNEYVHQTDLRGKIVYQRMRKERPFIAEELPSNALRHKLELKESPYRDWLEKQFSQRLLYCCVDSPAELGQYEKALTKSGLQKNGRRHQKDDRPRQRGASQYILGWDNKEKIRSLEADYRSLNEAATELREQLQKNHKAQLQNEQLRDTLKELLRFEHFQEINWPALSLEMEELEQERQALEAKDEQGRTLRQQLQVLNSKAEGLRKQIEDLGKQTGELQSDRRKLQEDKKRYLQLLQNIPPGVPVRERFEAFENRFSPRWQRELRLSQLPREQEKLEEELRQTLEQLNLQFREQDKRLSRLMNRFKEPSIKLQEQFPDWLSDTHQLSTDTQYVDEYQELLHKIEQDDLPRFQARFNKYLNEQMVEQMGSFREKLQSGARSIEENIRALNSSLRHIRYRNAPATYIQLQMPKNTQDQDIRQFRKMLDAAIPDALRLKQDEAGAYKQQIFQNIKALIDQLSDPQQQRWRDKVIDVRYWYRYYAEEFYLETQEPMKVYKDMGKLSGGEKAQLTYTILGSAIAYQFGIEASEKEEKSFRFVAVDESFSNQDDEKAAYLMNLCKQLRLQLLVVTPSDKINVVKRYISTIHYVRRKDNRESIVSDMPILDYEELRAAEKQKAKTPQT